MKIELTDEEITTVLTALDNYGDLMEGEFLVSDLPADKEAVASSERCWQKIYGQREEQFRNATADAVGEDDPSQPPLPFTDGTRDVVDPFDFVGLDPSQISSYNNMGDE